MDKLHKSFLGTGWSFPPQFDNEGGSVEMLSDGEDIRSSLEILLSTRPGERVMRPNYGCLYQVFHVGFHGRRQG
ncbi:MAG: hypothetical protein EAS52_24730, partial [Parapedobacter sp.]